MLAKFVATCLIVLSASPFTAPFQTCDLTTAQAKPTPIATLSHAADSIGAPAIRVAPRVRLLALSVLHHLSDIAVPAPSAMRRGVNATHRVGPPSTFTTVLRV
jgi:hypothetical protein